MQLSILQLNIWAGTHFPAIKDFLQKHDFDILCFQEVAGIDTHCGNVHSRIDCYEELQKLLGEKYHSQQAITDRFTSNPQTSYQGLAIFYKKAFQLLQQNTIYLYRHETLYPSDATSYEDMTRALLHLKLKKEDKEFSLLTAHLAWGPDKTERPHQRHQNIKLVEYMKQVQNPWILTGDFNIDPEQPSILELEKLGRNLTKEYQIPNTVDPVNHVHWQRIKPGFAVDYIFVSPTITVKNFRALDDVHMSDHIGLTATVSL